ncbi:GNAT family N-acetyltransferase [Aurantivibrio infirmus]
MTISYDLKLAHAKIDKLTSVMDIRDYHSSENHSSDNQSSDYRDITTLFHDAIHSIDTRIYSKQQLDAWAPSPIDYEHWRLRLDIKKPFIAVIDKLVVGFIELEEDGHIDCLYVHKDYQRQGIAKKLLTHLCEVAKRKGIRRLHVEASILAKPLFESFGFKHLGENTVHLRGQTLTNYKMVRHIETLKIER